MQDELKRGDVVKSVQCYMQEGGASEDEAREHMKFLMYETWKKMNKQVYDKAKCPFSKTFIRSAMNITRMSHVPTYMEMDTKFQTVIPSILSHH